MKYLRELFCYLFGHTPRHIVTSDLLPYGLSTLTISCDCCEVVLETQTKRGNF